VPTVANVGSPPPTTPPTTRLATSLAEFETPISTATDQPGLLHALGRGKHGWVALVSGRDRLYAFADDDVEVASSDAEHGPAAGFAEE